MCVGTVGLDMAMDRCLYPLVPHGDSQGWTQDFGGKPEQEYFSEPLVMHCRPAREVHVLTDT